MYRTAVCYVRKVLVVNFYSLIEGSFDRVVDGIEKRIDIFDTDIGSNVGFKQTVNSLALSFEVSNKVGT